MLFALPVIVPLATLAAVTKLHLLGRSHKRYDTKAPVTFETDPNSPGIKAVNDYLYENYVKPSETAGNKGIDLVSKRDRFEKRGLARNFKVTYTQDIAEQDGLRVDGEWTTPPGADPDRRILYIHGGAFTVGSAVSHRGIISNLALKTGCCVFAPNYRLMPENKRQNSIDDVRAVYKWILNNGPNGPASVKKLAVAGDSAGGNLTLMLSNWVRNRGLRAADAVVGISPATDATFESPSMKKNLKTDLMLRPLAGPLTKAPRAALVWFMFKQTGIAPSAPRVSPLRARLNDLPPTLIHASSAEILYDDARRYVAKAQEQGSPVKLQTWSNVCHVWHAFDQLLPEANDALDEIAAFLIEHGVGEAKPQVLPEAKVISESVN